MQLWRHTPKEIHLDWFVLSDLESFAHKSAHKDTIGEESAGYFTQPTKSVCLCVCGPVRLLVCHCVHLYNVFFSNIVHTEFKFHHFSQQNVNLGAFTKQLAPKHKISPFGHLPWRIDFWKVSLKLAFSLSLSWYKKSVKHLIFSFNTIEFWFPKIPRSFMDYFINYWTLIIW